MSHLIQPISILGTKHCIKHGDTYTSMDHFWRTVSVLDVTAGATLALTEGGEDADRWYYDGADADDSTCEVLFGVSCITSISVYFSMVSPLEFDVVDIAILLYPAAGGAAIEVASAELREGETPFQTLTVTGLDGTNPLLYDTPHACGFILSLKVRSTNYEGGVDIEVLDVT